MSEAEFRVWWIPQIPMTAFQYEVPTLDAGVLLCDALAKYDLFQIEHNVKPDYSNAGGIQWRHAELTEGDWYDVDPDDEYDMQDVQSMLSVAAREGEAE